MEYGRFLDLVRAFEEAKVDYILVGGVAVNLHGIVRATEDIDFFVRLDPANVERLKRALRSVWDDPEIDEIRPEDFGPYPTLRYGPPDEGLVIDILTRLGTRFAFDDLAWEIVTLEGVDVRVATPATLVRMKRDTLRPIDRACIGVEPAVSTGGRRKPIQRFRDFDEARQALWTDRNDPELATRIARLWTFAAKLAPGAAPRGIRRFRTIEEANLDRDAWTARRVQALREARVRR